jgi:hypothetical protein
MVYITVPVFKYEKSPDGSSLFVYGKATTDDLDLDDQIVDKDFARKALGDWFTDFYNIRQMHSGQLPPAGVGVGLDEKPDGFWLKSEVYEPGAMLQVKKGGFKAYSVGIAQPRIIRDAKAKNGRIVGGQVVEVSLVDYPANPKCKFAITEKALGGEMQILMKMVKGGEGAVCDACKGINSEKCNKCGGTGLAKEAEAFDSLDKPKDVKKAVKAFNASAPGALSFKDFVKREALRIGRQDLIPDDWKEVSITLQKRQDIDYAMQRLHDLTCQAYDTDAVKAAYPTLEKDGIAVAIGPNTKLALWQMLQNEIVEDNGTGKSAHNIDALGDAYQALVGFLQSEMFESAQAMAESMFAARAELHKLFVDANKEIISNHGNPIPTQLAPTHSFADAGGTIGSDASPTTGPVGSGILTDTPGVPSAESASGNVSPGKFRRGYLSAGRARQTGDGASAAPAKPANAGSGGAPKSHGGVDGAHQRQSPGDQKRAAMSLVDQLHNALMVAFPDINCCLEPPTPGAAPKSGKAKVKKVKGMKTAIAQPGDMDIPARKVSKAKRLKKRLKKQRKVAKKAKTQLRKLRRAAKSPNGAPKLTVVKKQKEPRGAVAPEAGQAADAADTDLPEGSVPPAKPGKKKKSKKAKLQKQIKKLKGGLKKMAKSTDPTRGPVRREALGKGVSPEVQKRKEDTASAERIEKRARLEHQAIYAEDASARDRAQTELMNIEKIEKSATADIVK